MSDKMRQLVERLKKQYGIEYTVGHSEAVRYGMDKHPLIAEAIAALQSHVAEQESEYKDCPHAAPFRYCAECVATPCPMGFGTKK